MLFYESVTAAWQNFVDTVRCLYIFYGASHHVPSLDVAVNTPKQYIESHVYCDPETDPEHLYFTYTVCLPA